MLWQNSRKTLDPWYRVEVCGKKLCLIFEKNSSDDWKAETDGEGDLIVLKFDPYQHLSYFAFNILLKYGSAAYPFTLEGAVKSSKREQQNQLVLSNLLSPQAPLCRRKEDNVDTTLSELFGKRILLLFVTSSCGEAGSFLPDLKRMYENKGTNDDFEIIYMSLDCDESPSSFSKSIQGMPWLVHAFVPHFSVVLAKQLFEIFPPQLPAIAAFGRNGHLETKASNLAFKKDYKFEYPFIQAADMDVEVSEEQIYLYKWDSERLSTAVSEGRSFIVESDSDSDSDYDS